MNKDAIDYNGQKYRYILSLLDVFSRFHWLHPLPTKHSAGVKEFLKATYETHGPPSILQSDNGKEFHGRVKTYCQKKKIKMIQSRPYHPQSNGKVERSHREIRKKISFDMLSHTRTGTNWVRNLPKYMSCVNNEKREALGWQSPFEIYFGRKNNNLVNCGLPIDTASPEVGLSRPPSKDDRSKFDIARFTAREKARKCNDRVDKRTVEYYRKRSKCSTYGVKEKVFVRIGDKKRAPKKRHVLTGTITKLGKNGNSYKVEYKNPTSGQLQNDWFSVENIADFGGKKIARRRRKISTKSS